MEEQIRTMAKFGGASHEDVVKWLQDIEEVFDRAQLRLTNKYIAVQSFLTNSAAKWFRYNKSNILDWPTFKREIIKTYQPSFNQTLLKMEEQQQLSSFFSSCCHDQHQCTSNEKLQKLEHEQSILDVSVPTPSEVSSTSTVSNKELDGENNQSDLVNDNRIMSFEDLEDGCLREYEQGHYSPMLVNIDDLDPKIQPQCADVADECDNVKQHGANVTHECDELEQQVESIIKSDSVERDVEDLFETIAGSMESLPVDDSLTNTVTPQDVQYLRFDKHRPPQTLCI